MLKADKQLGKSADACTLCFDQLAGSILQMLRMSLCDLVVTQESDHLLLGRPDR